MTENLPEFVINKIRELSAKTNESMEELVKQYWEIYNDPWIQSDDQFKTDEDRHAYAVRVLWVKIVSQPPVEEYTIIPFGIREPRIAKSSGIAQSRIYASVQIGDKLENKVIVCRGETAKLVYDIEPFNIYKVKLANVRGLLMATSQTRFEDPRPAGVDPIKFLVKQVNALPIKIIDAIKKPSRVDKGGYVDELDLRLIKGIVIRYNRFERNDGTKGAVYTISDDSVTKDMVTPDGKVIPSQFTVWIPSNMLRYGEYSELAFVGTISLARDSGEPFMNAICVIPIHPRPIEVISE